MPFRGRPSRGCETCRRRKIKCDLREPGCEKCEKAGWKCEGYRDLTSLLFHDESDRIIKKVHARKATRRRIEDDAAGSSAAAHPALPSPQSSAVSEVLSQEELQLTTQDSAIQLSRYDNRVITPTSPRPPPLSVLANLDDLAIAQFFDKYVYKYHDRRDQWSVDVGNGCLIAAMKALGTVDAVKQMGQGRRLEPEAQKRYVSAIQKINTALQDPHGRTMDSTLLAITILGIFECVSGFQRNLDSWREHVNGAASLLQLRGSEQFRTQTGCRL
ncbi:hypothetical protein CERZMDRAFT_7957, partial [Cercospora zeae-maydis SCOH1-5]